MKIPALQFYPGDWLRDDISSCSLSAQGLWLRMMIVMHDCMPYGHLAQKGAAMSPEKAAQRCGCTLDEYSSNLAELDDAGIPSRTATGCIYSRRMVRDHAIRLTNRANGRKGGNPKLLDDSLIPPVKPSVKPPDNPSLKRKSEDEDSGNGDGAEGENPATVSADSLDDWIISSIPGQLRTTEFKQAFAEWFFMCSQKGQPPVAITVRKQMAYLRTIGVRRAIAALDFSARNGYTGVVEPGTKKDGGTGTRPDPFGGVKNFSVKA